MTDSKQMIGILGAHRVGKTFLAREFAESNPTYDFIPTSTSRVFKEMGVDPKSKLDFETRMTVQEEVLRQAEEQYQMMTSRSILDRTPLDYATYVLSECFPSDGADPSPRVMDYVNRCIELTNEHFAMILVIQPGVEAPDEDGKAKVNLAYQEHLNMIAQGLLMREEVEVFKAVLPREVLDIEERVESLKDIIRAINQKHNRNMIEQIVH
jgi:hypothetical protein